MAIGTVLFVLPADPHGNDCEAGQLHRIRAEIEEHGFEVRWARNGADARAVLRTEAGLAAAVVAWDLPASTTTGDAPSGSGESDDPGGGAVLRLAGRRFKDLPIFLVMADDDLERLPLWATETAVGHVWPAEDTASFIAGRVVRAARSYLEAVLPPFFKALRHFGDAHHQNSWHTPAHSGGVAFLKSPVGRAFFDYFGERLLRSDLSMSVEELGSLFEHTGSIGDAERNAARIFGADRTYFVLHGDSTANRMVGHFSVTRDEIALVDRTCHPSILHGLVITGARPVYLIPTRNGYGLAGPLPPARLHAAAVADRIAANPLSRDAASLDAEYAVLTNSTYDGLCYDAVSVARALAPSTPRVHFDEAWFAYARFHPLYAGRYGMSVNADTFAGPDRPTVFSTQSTHKLLAALSQSAMVHVRPAPRAPVEHDRFNEAFMMHGTTSPLYPVIASLDVAAGMMDGEQGRRLIDDAVTEAIRFRQSMVRLAERVAAEGDRPPWFFGVWQPDTVTDPATGVRWDFGRAPVELLRTQPSCWQLEPEADWHGFPGLSRGYCLLDPVKVTLTCPGIDAAGVMADWGIPARVLTAYLATRNIVVEKTGSYTTLVLFSMGTTKSKWGTLLDALTDFKALHDQDAPLSAVLPDIVARHPHRYAGPTLRELCRDIHDHLRRAAVADPVDAAFRELPVPVTPPQQCYRLLVRGGTERVPLAHAAGRVAAAMVTVTPPGIPVLMPGEGIGPATDPPLRYLGALESFDRHFPGFRGRTHGVTVDRDTGDYLIECIRREHEPTSAP
jgi:arginine decarboxylase